MIIIGEPTMEIEVLPIGNTDLSISLNGPIFDLTGLEEVELGTTLNQVEPQDDSCIILPDENGIEIRKSKIIQTMLQF